MAVTTLIPPEYVIQAAIAASLNSPCQSKRGVCIFDHIGPESHNTFIVITTGWNDKPRGFECDGSNTCKANCGAEAVHAEQMALLDAPHIPKRAEMLHVKTVNGVLVPSGGPSCLQCSKLLVGRVAAMWLYHQDGWIRYPAEQFHSLTLKAHR